MVSLDQVAGWVRQNGLNIAKEALVNILGPLVVYQLAKPHYGEIGGLLISSIPPILWSLIELARHRRVDAVSILVLAGIVLSILAYFGGGSAHLLQLREKLVTALIGAVFLGSVAVNRPLIYELARASIARKSAEELRSFEALRARAGFRRTMSVMTLVWGFGLVAEAAVSAALVFVLNIPVYMVAGPIIGYGTMGALSLWSFWYGQRQKRKGQALRAAAEAQAQAAIQVTALETSPPP